MARIRGRGWCLLVLATETMSMRRGVPGGLRMAPAEAHDALGLIPLQFAGARGEWPRPRIPCPTCGDEMVLKWGDKRRPYFSHLPKWGGHTVNAVVVVVRALNTSGLRMGWRIT